MNDNERTPPETFLLLKFGANVYTKDGKEDSFRFDDASADVLISEFNSRSRDLVIDFEHSTLSGNEAPAAGWIDRLEKNAEGLCAHVKYWTDKARDYLIKGEYRYFSPTLLFGRGGKSPDALQASCAISVCSEFSVCCFSSRALFLLAHARRRRIIRFLRISA